MLHTLLLHLYWISCLLWTKMYAHTHTHTCWLYTDVAVCMCVIKWCDRTKSHSYMHTQTNIHKIGFYIYDFENVRTLTYRQQDVIRPLCVYTDKEKILVLSTHFSRLVKCLHYRMITVWFLHYLFNSSAMLFFSGDNITSHYLLYLLLIYAHFWP